MGCCQSSEEDGYASARRGSRSDLNRSLLTNEYAQDAMEYSGGGAHVTPQGMLKRIKDWGTAYRSANTTAELKRCMAQLREMRRDAVGLMDVSVMDERDEGLLVRRLRDQQNMLVEDLRGGKKGQPDASVVHGLRGWVPVGETLMSSVTELARLCGLLTDESHVRRPSVSTPPALLRAQQQKSSSSSTLSPGGGGAGGEGGQSRKALLNAPLGAATVTASPSSAMGSSNNSSSTNRHIATTGSNEHDVGHTGPDPSIDSVLPIEERIASFRGDVQGGMYGSTAGGIGSYLNRRQHLKDAVWEAYREKKHRRRLEKMIEESDPMFTQQQTTRLVGELEYLQDNVDSFAELVAGCIAVRTQMNAMTAGKLLVKKTDQRHILKETIKNLLESEFTRIYDEIMDELGAKDDSAELYRDLKDGLGALQGSILLARVVSDKRAIQDSQLNRWRRCVKEVGKIITAAFSDEES